MSKVSEKFSKGPFNPQFLRASDLIGKRWNAAIIYSLFHGLERFSEIAHAVTGLSKRVLSERLKEMEQEGIVTRKVVADTPVKITYHLTEKGLALREVLVEIHRWAYQWHDNEAKSPKQ
ncbi:MAG: winged helix-turn-helix transcriptional regulator [Trueperaceae bacterium]